MYCLFLANHDENIKKSRTLLFKMREIIGGECGIRTHVPKLG